MASSTALRVTGRDTLPLLHRVTSNALNGLGPGEARATLFCDFRGRLLHRVVVAVALDGAVWLLRTDAPAADRAAAVEKSIFRDDVHVEDRSAFLPLVLTRGTTGETGVLEERDGAPIIVTTGDGTRIVDASVAPPLDEPARI